ncbi:MAG TPA: cellulase [Xanthomonadaceae bacterium]|nr:cellulase [Xanthomonadaceae bacterium]
MTRIAAWIAVSVLCLPVSGCATPSESAGPSPVRLNQLGYLPGSSKVAVIDMAGAEQGRSFSVEDARGRKVFEGPLQPAREWAPAGRGAQLADFSALRRKGVYRLRVEGLPESDPFPVDAKAYLPLLEASLKAFYLNRASTAITPRYAGAYARAAGHPDTDVRIHASAASAGRPEGSSISVPKGWYDAGDYNKYIVNSGISTYTLLAAYEHYPKLLDTVRSGIPDHAAGVPDILQEAWWNLQWMLAMQDPADGGVYHKLTDRRFDAIVMPDQAHQQRYVVMKTTAATLDFAAVMAAASRVYAPFERQYPGQPARMLAAARAAWDWAQRHPQAIYRQPEDIRTGGYDDSDIGDEFAWAAAELHVATGEDGFYDAMVARDVGASVPSWASVGGLAWMTLAQNPQRLGAHADRARIRREIDGLAARLADEWRQSPWRVAMAAGDFGWGSNSVALNQAMMLLQGYRLSARGEYLQAAQSQLDYVLGRNPLGMSYVTGIGARSPLHIHHRISEADGIVAPVPGLLAGGPNPGQQDAADCKAAYPSALPALSYLDDACSYASNEVAINWNAPLVYVGAAIQALSGDAAR